MICKQYGMLINAGIQVFGADSVSELAGYNTGS